MSITRIHVRSIAFPLSKFQEATFFRYLSREMEFQPRHMHKVKSRGTRRCNDHGIQGYLSLMHSYRRKASNRSARNKMPSRSAVSSKGLTRPRSWRGTYRVFDTLHPHSLSLVRVRS